MRLYLLRHADAEQSAAKDELRALSDKGRRQARDVAQFCQDRKIAPALVLSSPLLRARQTAQVLAEKLGRELVIEPWLTSGMSPEEAAIELRAHQKCEELMLVGHEPDFSFLAAHLVGLESAENLHLRKASLTCIEIQHLHAGGGILDFTLPVRLM